MFLRLGSDSITYFRGLHDKDKEAEAYTHFVNFHAALLTNRANSHTRTVYVIRIGY